MNFYDKVYEQVRLIPRGRVTTYGAIAALAGNPMAPRAVGYALRALPHEHEVPWHRVVNKQGKISPRGSEIVDVVRLQRQLLEAEGVQFDANDCIDFKRFGWQGP